MERDSAFEASRRLLFVGTHGFVVALEKETGVEVWRTSLPSTGYSVVSIVPEDGRLLCGSGGHVYALDPESGDILWRNDLPGLGHDIISLTTVDSGAGGWMSVLAAQAAKDARSKSSGS